MLCLPAAGERGAARRPVNICYIRFLSRSIGSRWSLAMEIRLGVVGSSFAGSSALACRAGLPERDAEVTQQLASLVVVLGRGDDGDVHALGVLNFIGIDLREDDLLGQSQAVVAMAVEAVGVDAAKVTNSRQGHRDQAVEKLVHPPAAQRDLAADVVALSEPEAGDGCLGLGDHRLL